MPVLMSKKKDPAFLFYSRDFYEGTRTMLPEERACYVDLLIYQHQHGLIPLDLKRIKMYCSGIDEATLKATLEAKFIATDQGYYNTKQKEIIEERSAYGAHQSINGRVGQVMKKVGAMCNAKEMKTFKDYFYDVIGKEKCLEMLESEKTTLEGLLKASLKHLAIGDANENVDSSSENKKGEKIEFPKMSDEMKKAIEEFLEHRKAKRSPIKTQMQFDKWLVKLRELAKGKENQAVKIIDQSIANGWTGIFEIAQANKNGTDKITARQMLENMMQPIDEQKMIGK